MNSAPGYYIGICIEAIKIKIVVEDKEYQDSTVFMTNGNCLTERGKIKLEQNLPRVLLILLDIFLCFFFPMTHTKKAKEVHVAKNCPLILLAQQDIRVLIVCECILGFSVLPIWLVGVCYHPLFTF